MGDVDEFKRRRQVEGDVRVVVIRRLGLGDFGAPASGSETSILVDPNLSCSQVLPNSEGRAARGRPFEVGFESGGFK